MTQVQEDTPHEIAWFIQTLPAHGQAAQALQLERTYTREKIRALNDRECLVLTMHTLPPLLGPNVLGNPLHAAHLDYLADRVFDRMGGS